MKDFKLTELENYLENLTPAEQVFLDVEDKIVLDFIIDMLDDIGQKEISLVELLCSFKSELENHRENMKGE